MELSEIFKVEMKKCNKCGKVKSLEEFCRDRTRKDGREYRCKECKNAYNKTWYEANKERKAATSRACLEANRERKIATNRAWREANKERISVYMKAYREVNKEREAAINRAWYLMRTYGITLEEYGTMLEAQDGVCAFCGKTPEEANGVRNLSVDHDHETGEIRWLLCRMCNLGLGNFSENVGVMRKAADMLENRRSL